MTANSPSFDLTKGIALAFLAAFAFTQFVKVDIGLKGQNKDTREQIAEEQSSVSVGALQDLVLPTEGIVLPIAWVDLGKQMIETGVIDQEKFEAVYAERGGLGENEKKLLVGEDNGEILMTYDNSSVLLNMFWAFGLANKNPILQEGPMVTYGGGADSPTEALAKAGRFASTGGWTLAKGSAMDHYSKHAWVVLTPEQQALVEKVSQGIYRPCCGNPTYFPDCNHGMAMLGLLELMAAQGIGEEEMYQVALQVNSYWFPDTYLTIAKYFAEQGISWDKVSPKEVLGFDYSSAQGFWQVRAAVESVQQQEGPGCGI
ncbi:MAG: hypothetical protein A2672_02895 [Candidatus Wildermuthbacteria bacterium RIFCSPHIGHO2_01_FULL_49_22b]|uniref:Uncharacterized protein n=1 Tax=Candidatus Wildermuthbacteria bacterium RIFCSPHIGHO2_01_FULL_49_22b TaxID=1802448 RepID=A0A1G2QX91_9BACT|nr:MAG: hypothetical protein A2672_02895 [Candidatus Wildermuthbacteria bacterium RIFCSPHIGHO2_01_FULL_49_22b]